MTTVFFFMILDDVDTNMRRLMPDSLLAHVHHNPDFVWHLLLVVHDVGPIRCIGTSGLCTFFPAPGTPNWSNKKSAHAEFRKAHEEEMHVFFLSHVNEPVNKEHA